MTTKLDRPKVVHVYRSQTGSLFATFDKMTAFPNVTQELGEYVPRGPVIRDEYEVRWQSNDGSWIPDGRFGSKDDARSFIEEECGGDYACRIVHITTRKVCR